VAVYAMLVVASNMSGPTVSQPKDTAGLLKVYISAIAAASNQARFWFSLNMALQMMSVIIGTIATMMMALQNANNARWMKPIGIVATTLSTGIVTMYSAFHVRENADALFSLMNEITISAENLDDFNRRNPSDLNNPDKIHEFTVIINELGDKRRHVMSGIGNPLAGSRADGAPSAKDR
jgi:hypothetical protein